MFNLNSNTALEERKREWVIKKDTGTRDKKKEKESENREREPGQGTPERTNCDFV